MTAWAGNHQFHTGCHLLLAEGNLRKYFKYPVSKSMLARAGRHALKKMKQLARSMEAGRSDAQPSEAADANAQLPGAEEGGTQPMDTEEGGARPTGGEEGGVTPRKRLANVVRLAKTKRACALVVETVELMGASIVANVTTKESGYPLPANHQDLDLSMNVGTSSGEATEKRCSSQLEGMVEPQVGNAAAQSLPDSANAGAQAKENLVGA